MDHSKLQLFENNPIRSAWDEENEEWYFSIVDVVNVLTGSKDAAAYWRKLKQRLKQEGNQTVTKCHALKLTSADDKKRLTDVATTEQLHRHPCPFQAVSFQFLCPLCYTVRAAEPCRKKNQRSNVL